MRWIDMWKVVALGTPADFTCIMEYYEYCTHMYEAACSVLNSTSTEYLTACYCHPKCGTPYTVDSRVTTSARAFPTLPFPMCCSLPCLVHIPQPLITVFIREQLTRQALPSSLS